MLVRGSNYVRMDMCKLLSNKNHHRYRRTYSIFTTHKFHRRRIKFIKWYVNKKVYGILLVF